MYQEEGHEVYFVQLNNGKLIRLNSELTHKKTVFCLLEPPCSDPVLGEVFAFTENFSVTSLNTFVALV